MSQLNNREIDALIAEHIFPDEYDMNITIPEDGGQPFDAECHFVSAYSSNMFHSWKVLEKVTGKESFAEVRRVLHRKFGEEEVTVSYSATIMRKDGDVHINGAKTPSIAICLVALKACGVETKEVK